MQKLLQLPHLNDLRERARVLREIRRFLDARAYVEIEPPTLVPAPGLEIHISAVESRLTFGGPARRAYLHTSPELAMKKLLGAGMERIYAMGPVFRDGEAGDRHNPEFTMLEWYRAGFTAAEMMDETEALVREVTRALGQTLPAIERPFTRLKVKDALLRHAGIDCDALPLGDAGAFADRARAAGVRVPEGEPWDDIFNRVFLERIEPKLEGAVFLYEYPIELAVLARPAPHAPRYAERFELFVVGLELCNGFGELTDPVEQRARFVREQDERRARGLEVYPIDEDFLRALAHMPPSAGNALGVDRLVMLILGRSRIAEVRAFCAPQLFAEPRRFGDA